VNLGLSQGSFLKASTTGGVSLEKPEASCNLGSFSAAACTQNVIPFIFRLINPEQSKDSSSILLSQSRFILTPYDYTVGAMQQDRTAKSLLTFSLVDASYLTYLTEAVVPNLQVCSISILRRDVTVF
jgi:hypothetical protein